MAPPDAQIVEQIDAWYGRAPAGLSTEEAVEWVQDNSEIPCPQCGEWLWVVRGENAGGRGLYHLALCQNPGCDFQFAH